jgi:hypothetical protein
MNSKMDAFSGFTLGALALLAAFHSGRYYEAQKPETVSFNDGSTLCDGIEINRYANRRDIADALTSAADSVDRIGCANITFIEESGQ